jgi:type VI secretion system secreted protein VgrG
MGFSHHRLEISFTAVGDDLSVRRFAIEEALSELWSVSVLASTENHDLPLAKIIGEGAGFRVSTATPTMPTRKWAGIVSRCEQLHANNADAVISQSTYYFEIVPQLWRATQRRNHRVFQQLSLPDVVKVVLAEWDVKGDWKLTRGEAFYPKHDYVVQYGETDYAFMRRILERAGITFFFNFVGVGDEPDLVLSDDPSKGLDRGVALPAFDEPPSSPPREYAKRIRTARTVQPGKYLLRDYEFRRAYNTELVGESKSNGKAPEDFYEQYEYTPGEFVVDKKGGQPSTPVADDRGMVPRHDDDEGARVAEQRLLAKRKRKELIRYESNVPDLAPGVIFKFDGHPRDELDGAPLLATRCFLEGSPGAEWTIGGVAIPKDVPWVPEELTPRPRILGMQSALVVGPKDQEIHTDEHGRVRVQFHWDREGKYDEKSSCWLRVSQDWAGVGYGSFVLPRVGHEVMVAFYDGDPDQPVVVGRVYGDFNKVPYELPKHKTRSTWKSDSTPKGDGLNEIMLEDKAGEELFYLQAERDLDKLVKKYESERTHDDHMQIVGEVRETVVGELEATMVGKRYFMQMMTKPGDGDLKIQEQDKPTISPLDTAIDMIDEQIIFTTGKATVAFDGKNIRLEASGNVTINAKGADCILEGKQTKINSGGPAAAPKPDAWNALEPGDYQSHKADVVEAMTPEEMQPHRQHSDDLDEIFAEAAEADVKLRAITEMIAKLTNGTPMYPPGLKGRERSMEKIAADYGGDPSQLLDVSRASIVFDNMEDIKKARELLGENVEIVREKDRFSKPAPGGYRDMMLNVRVDPGHVCEIQLHSNQILEVKSGEGHAIYEEMRTIEGGAKKDKRPLTAKEKGRVEELSTRSEEVYGNAYKNFTGGG